MEAIPEKKYNQNGSPINNLHEVKETMSEEGENQPVHQSAVLERLNWNHSPSQIELINRDDIENINLDEHEAPVPAPPTNRKSFKKVIRSQNNSAV